MTHYLLMTLAAATLTLERASASGEESKIWNPSRARLCAALLESEEGRPIAGEALSAELGHASAHARAARLASTFAVGRSAFGPLRKLARLFTAPYLGERLVLIGDVQRPDEGHPRSRAIGQISLAGQVDDALRRLERHDSAYVRLTAGRADIQRQILRVLAHVHSREESHRRSLGTRAAAEAAMSGAPGSEVAERPLGEETLKPGLAARAGWGRWAAFGTGVGLGVGLGYVVGLVAPPSWRAFAGAATLASALTGFIVFRERVAALGSRLRTKLKTWAAEPAEASPLDRLERARPQLEHLEQFLMTVTASSEGQRFGYFAFNSTLPVREFDANGQATAEAIERALDDEDASWPEPLTHVRTQLVLYSDGEDLKLITVVDPIEDPYLYARDLNGLAVESFM